ncbi:MAG: hypothetical protein R3E11_12705 [Sphingobium sp.]|jgi:hypothetical protein|nr:hypothetical protein [Sphingobium sp.]MCP5399257.1 hypothetical protein [Sphingomonas sp.]
MDKESAAQLVLSEFTHACYVHYTCFVFATLGIPMVTNQFGEQEEIGKVFIGPSPPEEGNAHSVISVGDLRAFSRKDGRFTDIIAKSTIVSLFAEWDEHYRPKFAATLGIKPNEVENDLMGDVRKIRNLIVHKKIAKNTRLSCLSWDIDGDFCVTTEMMGILMDHLHKMKTWTPF